jgi:phosphoribosylanthranilate isomerase
MNRRTRIKICGITTLADALYAAELGADALGFIFYPQSPRYIPPEQVRAILRALPPFVTAVAVMVHLATPDIAAMMTASGCQVAQLYGECKDEDISRLPYPVIKAFSVSAWEDLTALAHYPSARAFLLDTKQAGQYGGTGAAFDWRLARQTREYGKPIILAGGLSPENIGEALRTATPDAVDVNSGIEISPGRKDPQRMRALFDAIREHDS